MAAVDPYSPCPCGSQEKYKWCCHKAEDSALRAERLIRGEQLDQALKVIEDGLKKARDAYWLLLQKAIVHERLDQPSQAMAAVNAILKSKPDHLGALAQKIQLTLIAEGPARGALELQSALSAVKPEDRPNFGGIFRMIGVMLVRSEQIPSGIAHLQIGAALESQDDPMARQALRSIMQDSGLSPWLKNPYALKQAPASLSGEVKQRFDEAMADAGGAHWARASARFETLAADGVLEAEHNLGLCRLWTADEDGAVEALRRFTKALGPTPEAVDLETLCQLIESISDDDQVEHVRLTWPIADREALFSALKTAEENEKDVAAEGTGVMDPDDPDAPEVEVFSMLDRPRPDARPGMAPAEMARVIGRVLVAEDSVLLDGFDVGKQFDRLRERFTELAGSGIPPAHPRTTVLEKVAKVSIALRTEWVIPEGLEREEVRRIQQEEQRRVLQEVWPETPLPGLGGRTPRQAAKDGDAEIALRASFSQIEVGRTRTDFDLEAFRKELGIPAEPTPDPATIEIEKTHLARLFRIPAEHLDNERLWQLFLRSRSFGQHRALERSARVLADRPSFLESRGAAERLVVFNDLANLAAGRGEQAEALAWVDRGRAEEPASHKAANAPRWEFIAIRIRSRFEPPEQWVPTLAIILDRYREDRNASQIVMSNLLDMGLIEMAPHPERPDQMMLDSRPLMAVLSQYGPRVTTASGELGVSATRPEIWTPDRASGGSGGGVWTPGSPGGGGGAGQGGERKIILPGQ
jgi:tetratricopeptide (TPR) repeat protein